jgi:putative molybdopterin biosynthesis protein
VSTPPTRHFLRDAPLPEALRRWAEVRVQAGCPERTEAVSLPVADALGRVLAAPVWAARSSPPFDAAAMDGFAVHSVQTVGASETTPARLDPSAFARVDTGDPLPADFDAVVMREHAHQVDGHLELLAAVAPYQHVRSIGEDITATELLLPEGQRLRAIDLAAAASAGARQVTVFRRPIVAVIPTGDELRPLAAELGPGEIHETNGLMLGAQAQEEGYAPLRFPIQRDDPIAIAAALRDACRQADVVLVSAGSSAGRDDYTAQIVEQIGVLAVHGVAVKPGHPVVLGAVDETPVIGVPGYPVSAAMTFDLFALPVLVALEGASRPRRVHARARLARQRADWLRVRLGRVDGALVASPLSRGAGVLTSLVRADGLLVVPAAVEGHLAGADVEVELLRDMEAIDRTIVVVGSHDMVLDLAASALRAHDPGVTLASSNVGSLGGLIALRDGLCHVAGSHLLDPVSGDYTLPYLDRIFGERAAELAVVRLADREQGLIVAPGNPHAMVGWDDLTRPDLRFVNRQRGSGTRMLLDRELEVRGIDPARIAGFTREEFTHLAVAAAVAAGRADCGLGVAAAARAFQLDFVPLATEPFDLVLRRATLDDPTVAPLFALLSEPAFQAQITALGGYDAAATGSRVY